MSASHLTSPSLPQRPGPPIHWGKAPIGVTALAIAELAQQRDQPILLITEDVQHAARLQEQIRFFLGSADIPLWTFPDWETLPYDIFSPLPELISQRLLTLHALGQGGRGILIVPVASLMQRLAPRSFVDANSLLIDPGQQLDFDAFRERLVHAGYRNVAQVLEHGEFAVRGSLIDLFPMGSDVPYRIDLFDDEVDSIRTFDPETQRTLEKVPRIQLLPAREFPLNDDAIKRFRKTFRETFDSDPQASLIYRDVSDGKPPGGIEYYLPLFFEQTATLFDYLPAELLVIRSAPSVDQATTFHQAIAERYEQRRHDIERPILPPDRLYLDPATLEQQLDARPQILFQTHELPPLGAPATGYNFPTAPLPALQFQARAERPAAALQDFLAAHPGRVLFVAETAGRRESLIDTLGGYRLRPSTVSGWGEFLHSDQALAITAAPLEDGLWLREAGLCVIPETLLLGERVQQSRRRRRAGPDADLVVRNLTELQIGAPVVHEEHGVGRYLGLHTLDTGDSLAQEFLSIEYARGDKLYVPVSALHLISRYTGASPEEAPLHRLGSDQWEKAKRKAAQKVRDVAAELLDIYARRAARQGTAFADPGDEYRQFAASFPFEETPDQAQAIAAVVEDLLSPQPMDRVVCGDVGFGKTEVAMRAAFVVANAGAQVAILVPTTLLAQQHYQNFNDRFADWPIQVESLSRFRSAKESKGVLAGLAEGKVDIVVGTHKLLADSIRFKRLGLVIIDEEQRFGVRHKERLKALRAEVDILTLTATPIPRTLNMAMAGLRDLSIIATPPVARHPVKTFVSQWNDVLIQEACLREIKRGGQVYFLHNEVESIQKIANNLGELLPESRIQVAHGQMPERELEQIMRDFYHRRFDILVCTTIIESGIDIPTANTIVMNRADKLGLAQLHQLRGRVGRSHHRAYAYLITPHPKAMTPDAVKRLEAIEALEDLGAGFTLATHDLEIRGAGELLGDVQSGQISEIGYTLYTEMLERAVNAIRAGNQPELSKPLDQGTEIDLHLSTLLPDDYIPDVHMRLIQYKRLASADTLDDLRELKVEMIDRFGLLPEPAQRLFDVTELKLRYRPFGIRKIEAGPRNGRLLFGEEPKIDPARIIELIQTQPQVYKLDGADKLRFYDDLEEPAQRIARTRDRVDQVVGLA